MSIERFFFASISTYIEIAWKIKWKENKIQKKRKYFRWMTYTSRFLEMDVNVYLSFNEEIMKSEQLIYSLRLLNVVFNNSIRIVCLEENIIWICIRANITSFDFDLSPSNRYQKKYNIFDTSSTDIFLNRNDNKSAMHIYYIILWLFQSLSVS